MIEPLPQFFSICAIARFNAFFLSSPITETAISPNPLVVVEPETHPNKIRNPERFLKLILSSSYLKCVLDVDHLGRAAAEENADDVEPEIVAGGSLTRHPIPSCTRHFPLLSPVYRTERSTITRRHPGLYLDEGNETSLVVLSLHYEVDITVSTLESPLYNLPAIFDQPLLCDPLASPAKLLLCC
jgi:hypothetical protein